MMETVQFEWQLAANDRAVTRCHAIGDIQHSGRAVGGYIDNSERGGSPIFLPWVEVVASVPDCTTVEEAKAHVEQLSARLLAVIAEWEKEVQEGA